MAERFTFPQTGDKDDAEHFGSLAGMSNVSDYIESGMNLQNYDSANDQIDITTGKCFISQSSETASSSGDTILVTNSAVQLPAKTDLQLASSSVNDIYVDPNFGSDDAATYAATTGGNPSGTLKIGEVDTSTDTVDQDFNRDPAIVTEDIADSSGNTIYNFSNGYVPLSILQNDSVTVTAGNQLTGGGTITLGGSATIDLNEGDGSGLDADSVDGHDLTVSSTAPTGADANDLWLDTS